jgi:glycine cleavage system H protein
LATVRGCFFPDHLLYDVPNHIWYTPLDDGTVRAGMNPIAIALAREVLVFTPKRVGREVEKGRSFATIESAKWVGAAHAAFDGIVVAVNEMLIERPTLANSDPYGEGWMLIVRPAHDNWREGLVSGSAIGPAYEEWMEGEGFAGCAVK